MTVAARALRRTTAWTIPAYRYLLGSEAASLSGSAVSTIALPALAVLELHATTGEVAVLAFLGQLPSTLALWAGALSDRYAKRRQLIAADLTAAAALANAPTPRRPAKGVAVSGGTSPRASDMYSGSP
ncbi:hypothetical protein [Streptomyces lydicus]|uniref:hypothetical protein n=1 Tax=Streptomyces lydicus TaxID=47763 RepID=UPI003701B0FF